MDERQMPAALSMTRMATLALIALGGSYGGAFLTSETLTRLADAHLLTPALSLHPDGSPGTAWLLATAAGGMLIGLLAVALGARVRARRAAPGPAPPAVAAAPLGTRVTPAESLAWLNIVSGPSGRRVGLAAAEIAASWIARGERVLLIDGGPRLRLHGPLVAEPTLGLSECLRRDLPLLGVVQCVGVPGLYVLVHGGAFAPRAWAGLGRLVDDARQHFDRVLLALDLGAPYEVGRALAGRFIEAWWSDPAPERGAGAQSLSERIGMRLRGMELGHETKPMLEVVRERIEALREAGAPRPEELPVGEARPRPEPAPAIRRVPLVLDCDLQVRERLRFLMWMRRLQREERGGTVSARARVETVPQTVISG
jgi:hypothetical protein